MDGATGETRPMERVTDGQHSAMATSIVAPQICCRCSRRPSEMLSSPRYAATTGPMVSALEREGFPLRHGFLSGHHFSMFYTDEDRSSALPARELAAAARDGIDLRDTP